MPNSTICSPWNHSWPGTLGKSEKAGMSFTNRLICIRGTLFEASLAIWKQPSGSKETGVGSRTFQEVARLREGSDECARPIRHALGLSKLEYASMCMPTLPSLLMEEIELGSYHWPILTTSKALARALRFLDPPNLQSSG